MPGVFADRRPDPGVAYGIRPAQRPGVENPDLIKNGFVGQVVFQNCADNVALAQDEIRVVERYAVDPWPANGQRGAVYATFRQCAHCVDRCNVKGRFAHQILRIVASDEHFRQRDKIGPGVLALLPKLVSLFRISEDITDNRVELSQCYAKPVGHLTIPCLLFPPFSRSEAKEKADPAKGVAARCGTA